MQPNDSDTYIIIKGKWNFKWKPHQLFDQISSHSVLFHIVIPPTIEPWREKLNVNSVTNPDDVVVVYAGGCPGVTNNKAQGRVGYNIWILHILDKLDPREDEDKEAGYGIESREEEQQER